MAVVSKIEKQKRRNRYNIYLDGVYSFSLSENTIVKFCLKKGDDLGGKEVERIRAFEQFQKIYARALLILSYREHSEVEIRTKLERKFGEEVVESVIKKLRDEKFIDDEKFATLFIEQSKKGRNILRLELARKGLELAKARDLVAKHRGEARELELATEIAGKIQPRLSGLIEHQAKKKLFDYLGRRGFPYDVCRKVVDEQHK